MIINIGNSLKERFAAILPDNYKRRIIFWHDPDGEFADMIDDLHLDGVKILKLTGNNNFVAKVLLSDTDQDNDYLVYDPLSYSDIRDNWLLDIELYSEEFRADLVSMRMQELNMAATPQMRKAIKICSKFFDSKERVAKLAALKSDYSNAMQLHIDIMAVLSSARANNATSVIKAILLCGLDIESNEAIANIKKFGNESIMWEIIKRYTDYEYAGDDSLIPLAEHILMTALSDTVKSPRLNKFDDMISPAFGQACYEFINEWIHSQDDDGLYEIAREIEDRLDLALFFDNLNIEEFIGVECFPCINECILRKYMLEISDDVIKSEDIIAVVEKRRTMKWYKRVRYYYDGLIQVALMQQFYQQNKGSFHIAEHGKFWKAYCENYYKMDQLYRRFHAAFNRSLKESCTVLDDLYKNVADYVERIYKNWYLSTLGGQWTMLVADEFAQSTRLPDIPNQADFYKNHVKPIVAAGSRVYVIISDALRYEVGVELTEELIKDTRGTAKISAMQAVFPSITKFGMAALLPHENLQLTENVKVLCDGMSTEGNANREKILCSVYPGNAVITYKELLAMKQVERRNKVKDARVVYIYHNTIDAVGDKPATEDRVFDACEQAVNEIKNLVRMIVNDMSGTNIIITADHGFLYSYKPLEESDKAEKSFISGHVVELDRRYVLTDCDCTADHMLRLPMAHINSDLIGFTPLDNIRIKKKGGGMNYVHGGISLQESVIPVIEFKNIRSSSKKYVEIKKAGIKLISQSRKVSNSIFSLDFYQKDAVGGKTVEATYEIYMADASGKQVSDVKTIIADKTSPDDSDRVSRIRLALKSMEFKKTDTYYLTIAEKDTANIVDRIEFTISIAFMNDFDF